MTVFERPGPVNTDAVIDLAQAAAAKCDCVVVASVTGDSALRVAERIGHKKILCVTCPQGMNWEVDRMDDGPFAAIPELAQIRADWRRQGLSQVPMYLTAENRERLERLNVDVVRGTIPLFGPTFSMRVHLRKVTDLDVAAFLRRLVDVGDLRRPAQQLPRCPAHIGVVLQDRLDLVQDVRNLDRCHRRLPVIVVIKKAARARARRHWPRPAPASTSMSSS